MSSRTDGLMETPLVDLDSAINDYLEAYKGFQKYLKASETLYLVFVSSWCGSPRHCAEAFATFSESLRKQWTFKHLDVSEVIPSRNTNSE
jgi:hypothetical protein